MRGRLLEQEFLHAPLRSAGQFPVPTARNQASGGGTSLPTKMASSRTCPASLSAARCSEHKIPAGDARGSIGAIRTLLPVFDLKGRVAQIELLTRRRAVGSTD